MYNAGCTFTGAYTMTVSTGSPTYSPLDGRFVPIDGNTITLDGSNQLQVAYKNGDKYKNANYQQLFGYITNGGKDVQVSVVVPKSLKNISSVTVNKLEMVVRGVGGYVGGSSYVNYAADTTNYTITPLISSDNYITITVTAGSA